MGMDVGWFTRLYSRNEHNMVKQLYSNKKEKKNQYKKFTREANVLNPHESESVSGHSVLFNSLWPHRL